MLNSLSFKYFSQEFPSIKVMVVTQWPFSLFPKHSLPPSKENVYFAAGVVCPIVYFASVNCKFSTAVLSTEVNLGTIWRRALCVRE